MTRDDIDWTGCLPALTTPFGEGGAIDEEGFAANLVRLIGEGATGAIVAGCTGEFWSLDLAEKARLGRLAVQATGGRVPILLGAAAIRVQDVIAVAHEAAEAGCAAILVTPPFFVRNTDAEIIAHFEAVSAASPLPVVLYNIPGNAGNWITPAIASACADFDKVVAIKESSGDWLNFHATLIAVRDRIRVFCGPSSVFGMAAAKAGADGFMDCFPNVWKGCLDLWPASTTGDLGHAQALQARLMAMTRLFTSDGCTLYPATKAAMNHRGLPGGGWPRPPLKALEGETLARFLTGYDALLAEA